MGTKSHAWALVLVFLALDGTLCQVQSATGMYGAQPQAQGIAIPEQALRNVDLLRSIWKKSLLLVEVPKGRLTDEQIRVGSENKEVASGLLSRLPPAMLAFLGSNVATAVLEDADRRADDKGRGAPMWLRGNKGVQRGIGEAISKVEMTAPVMLASLMELRQATNGSVAQRIVESIVTQAKPLLERPEHPMRAGRPVAMGTGTGKTWDPNGAYYAFVFGFLVMFSAVLMMIPIMEWAAVEGKLPLPPQSIGHYSTNTVFGLFSYMVEYALVIMAVAFCAFQRIANITHFHEQAGTPGYIFYLHLLLFAILPLSLIVATVSGIAKQQGMPNTSEFAGHVLLTILISVPVLLLLVLLWKASRLKSKNEKFSDSLEARLVELYQPYQTREFQQFLPSEDVRDLQRLVAWYGNREADMRHGVKDTNVDEKYPADGFTVRNPRGLTTFQNLVFSDNCKLVDYAMGKYNDELLAIACNGQKSPACRGVGVNNRINHLVPPAELQLHSQHVFIARANHEYAKDHDIAPEDQSDEGSVEEHDDAHHENPAFLEVGSGTGRRVEWFNRYKELDNEGPRESQATKPGLGQSPEQLVVQRINRDFNNLVDPKLPACRDVVEEATAFQKGACPYAHDHHHTCPCDAKSLATEFGNDECATFCSYACVADEVFKRVHVDIDDYEHRAAVPQLIDDINSQYVGYFIALALILAAAGGFFGVHGECGPLMTPEGEISTTPHCAITSTKCDRNITIPHGKAWYCSNDATKDAPEKTQCILVCEDGYTSDQFVSQCRSAGFMLTSWTHVNPDLSVNVNCRVVPDPCTDMAFSLTYADGFPVDQLHKTGVTVPVEADPTQLGDPEAGLAISKSSYLILGHSPDPKHGSISLYVKPEMDLVHDPNAKVQTILAFRENHGATLMIAEGNRLTVDASGTSDYLLTWAAEEWHHVVLSWEVPKDKASGIAFFHIDGVLVKEVPIDQWAMDSTVWVGNGKDADGTERPFEGTVRQVRVFSKVLENLEHATKAISVLCPTKHTAKQAAVEAQQRLMLAQVDQGSTGVLNSLKDALTTPVSESAKLERSLSRFMELEKQKNEVAGSA